MLKESDKSPEFCLKNPEGKDICLKDFKGKNIVIYFYPKDNTPSCTIEAVDFTCLKNDFEKINTHLIGISKDSQESHQKFIDKKQLTITLLSDPESKVQKKFGVWRKKKFMGREFIGTVRSTFLIDKNQKIVKIWDPVSVKGHANQVLEHAKKLK